LEKSTDDDCANKGAWMSAGATTAKSIITAITIAKRDFEAGKPICIFNLCIFYLRSSPYQLLFTYTGELELFLEKSWSELFVGSKDERCRDGTMRVVTA
jgi:hypothetical protein